MEICNTCGENALIWVPKKCPYCDVWIPLNIEIASLREQLAKVKADLYASNEMEKGYRNQLFEQDAEIERLKAVPEALKQFASEMKPLDPKFAEVLNKRLLDILL